jgi:hypothetical protein
LCGFHGAIVTEADEIGEVKEPKEVQEVEDGALVGKIGE